MVRYSVASASMESGVRISCKLGFTIATPTTVATMHSRNVISIVVCAALLMRSWFFAPYAWLMTAPAPSDRPLHTPMSMLIMLPVEPTAPSAVSPTKLPTTMLSTALYSCWKSSPTVSGSAKSIYCRRILPCVISASLPRARVMKVRPSLRIHHQHSTMPPARQGRGGFSCGIRRFCVCNLSGRECALQRRGRRGQFCHQVLAYDGAGL